MSRPAMTSSQQTSSSSSNTMSEQETLRKLSDDEIQDIIYRVFREMNERVSNIPLEIRQSILLKQQKMLEYQLRGKETYPSLIPVLIKRLEHQLHKSQIAPGESIGILCAQSIGERQTQMTLNTFHAAGMTVQTVITGVPRFLELLNASKEPKISSTKCFVQKKYESIQKLKQEITKDIIDVHMPQLYHTYEVLPNTSDNHKFWYNMFHQLYVGKEILEERKRHQIFESTKYFVRYSLSKEAMYRYNISTYEIAERLYRKYEDIYCIFSPNYQCTLDVFMDLSDIRIPVEEDEAELVDGGGQGVEGDDEDSLVMKKNKLDPEKLKFLTNENKDLIYIEEVLIPQIDAYQLFGIPNIKDYFIEKVDDDYILHTKGNNFEGLLSSPHILADKTISNNMWNIYERLGIEATREFLVSEFTKIVSSDGTFINQCHITLLVDIMTFSGSIISISRYGMKNDQFGPLAKASFEESLDNFLKAGFFSEKETTQDVSASIICGKRPNVGTGLCSTMLDLCKML